MNKLVVTLLAGVLVVLTCAVQDLGGARGPAQVTHAIGPLAIMKRYCQLDADGGLLTSGGRKEMAALVVPAGVMTMPEEVTVIRSFYVSGPTMTSERQALVRVDYVHLGFLETATGRFRQEAPGLHLAGDLTLSLSGDAWKIDGPVPGAFVTVASATRYVADLRHKTTAINVRKNADRTLAALKRLR